MPAPTGAHTTLWYYWEDEGFAQSPNDTDKKVYGGDAALSQLEGSNNAVRVFQPNSREAAQLIAQHFDGAFSVDFQWTNPWWLQGLISEASTTQNGDGTYTHTFDGDVPLSMNIVAGFDERAVADGEDPGYRHLRGAVVESGTVDVSVEGVVEVSLTGAYVSEEWVTASDGLDSQPSLDFDVMTFADAMLNLDGAAQSLVQDANVEVQNNTDIIRELGTRIGVDYSPKDRVPSVDFTRIQEDQSQREALYGSDAATTIEDDINSDVPMTFSVDDGGSPGNSASLNMDGAFPESASTENLGNPQEDLQESLNRMLRTVSAEATNDVETAP